MIAWRRATSGGTSNSTTSRSCTTDRIHAAHFYFDEYRSNCASNVMVYLQRMPVSHASYLVGKYYISPANLRDESDEEIPELFVDSKKRQGTFPF
jgi:hypothetical protein